MIMEGEKIYEYELDVTGVVDYGISLDDVLSGKTSVPMQGARIDVAFDGRATGRLAGRVHGIDHLLVRADGRVDLDIRAVVETEDGQKIALAADGVCLPRAGEPIADLRENVELMTAFEDYAWVNTRQVWGVGTVNFAKGKIRIEAYMQ
jgi:Protein of unknown function (DUF3237)